MSKDEETKEPAPGAMHHALCLISHELPGDEPGRFKRFEAGTVYEVDEPDGVLFRAVYGASEGTTDEGRGTKARRKAWS